MNRAIVGSRRWRRLWRRLATLFLIAVLLAAAGVGPAPAPTARAQDPVRFDEGIDPLLWYMDHEIEHEWRPDYLHLATGDPYADDHGVYEWPFALDSIGWSMQSYQDYGGTPYFHHGMDMMKVYGTNVYNQSGGQVINIENYRPGWDLYWEVAILDLEGYIWQYHHIRQDTIPQYIWDKFAEYQADPIYGGFISPTTYIGDIIEWPVWSFGKQFNHIHLNILGAGGVYLNGFEFHVPLPDTVGPEIQAVGLLKNHQVYPGNEVFGEYSLYVRARDLILDDVYYLPPFEILFSVDGGPEHTTWRFDTLPGGADRYAYLNDFYVVPPTCGNYSCRDYYIDLGFIPGSLFQFPCGGGPHTILVTVRDYAGNADSQLYDYTVTNYPPVAYPQTVSTPEDAALPIVLTGSDPNCDLLTFTVTAGPSHGILGGTAPNLTYTPTLNYYGADAFSFVVSDGLLTSTAAVVDITVQAVNDPPVADPQSLSTPENTPLGIVLTGSDVEGDPLTFAVVAGPGHGVLGGMAPNLVYTPTLDYSGPDAFTFTVSDGQLVSDPAVADIKVLGPNSPPTADAQSVSTPEDTALGIVLSGSDPEGDPLTFAVVSGPGHGTLGGVAPHLVYTPTLNYNGADAFSFVVSDGLLTSTAAVVDIAVQAVNDAPVAGPLSLSTLEDTPLAIVLSGSDVEGDPLTFRVVAGPGHGTLGGVAPHLVYTPTLNYNGADAFSFVVSDGLLTSTAAVVDIAVQAVNDAPVANPLSVTTLQGHAVAITLTGSDVEGAGLTYRLLAGPSHGTLSGTAPHLVYRPAAGYNGPDSFSFLVNDGELDSAPAMVGIQVRTVFYLMVVFKP